MSSETLRRMIPDFPVATYGKVDFFHGFQPASVKLYNPNPKAPYVPQWFTDALKTACGTTDNGRDPRVRIVWGGTETHFAYGRMRIKYPKQTKRVPIAWECIVTVDGQERRVRYSLDNMPEDTPGYFVMDWVDVGQPFFFLEEWCPPEVACDGWERIRRQYNRSTGELEDVLGPAPKEGLYKYLLTLKTDEGEYMAPNESTLEWVHQMLFLRSQSEEFSSWDWRQRPPARVVEGVLRNKYDEIYRRADTAEAEAEDRVYQLLKPFTKALTAD